jgi:hypothetical protein
LVDGFLNIRQLFLHPGVMSQKLVPGNVFFGTWNRSRQLRTGNLENKRAMLRMGRWVRYRGSIRPRNWRSETQIRTATIVCMAWPRIFMNRVVATVASELKLAFAGLQIAGTEPDDRKSRHKECSKSLQ